MKGLAGKIKRKLDETPELVKDYLYCRKISKITRYKNFETKLLGHTIECIDSASFLFMFKEIFRKEIYKFASNKKDPVIIDCGANIGLSVIYFKQLFPKAIITAFEPDLKIFDVLKKNVESFGYPDVSLINKGVWNTDGTLSFFSEGADAGHIEANANEANSKIEVTSLRPFLNKEIDFLKIDIEGAEYTVLEDVKDLLHNVPNIFIEYHSYSNKQQVLSDILYILKNAGYRFFITAPGLTSPYPFIHLDEYEHMDMQLNIYCIRQ